MLTIWGLEVESPGAPSDLPAGRTHQETTNTVTDKWTPTETFNGCYDYFSRPVLYSNGLATNATAVLFISSERNSVKSTKSAERPLRVSGGNIWQPCAQLLSLRCARAALAFLCFYRQRAAAMARALPAL